MFRTDMQVEFSDELNQMIEDQEKEWGGYAFSAGYLKGTCVDMFALLPKREQKHFMKRIAEMNGDVPVKVKNILSGIECEIPRRDRGTCNDPSMELYHTM